MGNMKCSEEDIERIFSDLIYSFKKLSKLNDAGYIGGCIGYINEDFFDKTVVGLFFEDYTFRISSVNESTFNLYVEEKEIHEYENLFPHELEQIVLTFVYEEKKKATVPLKADFTKWEEEGALPLDTYDKILESFKSSMLHIR